MDGKHCWATGQGICCLNRKVKVGSRLPFPCSVPVSTLFRMLNSLRRLSGPVWRLSFPELGIFRLTLYLSEYNAELLVLEL